MRNKKLCRSEYSLSQSPFILKCVSRAQDVCPFLCESSKCFSGWIIKKVHRKFCRNKKEMKTEWSCKNIADRIVYSLETFLWRGTEEDWFARQLLTKNYLKLFALHFQIGNPPFFNFFSSIRYSSIIWFVSLVCLSFRWQFVSPWNKLSAISRLCQKNYFGSLETSHESSTNPRHTIFLGFTQRRKKFGFNSSFLPFINTLDLFGIWIGQWSVINYAKLNIQKYSSNQEI